VGTGVADWNPPLCLVKLPHKDGGKWEATVTEKDKKTGVERITKYKLAAFGPEEVKVPAGTFMCIRVEEENDGVNRESTSWYAPGVGLVKSVRVARLTVNKAPEKMETVLTSFTPGKK
jgi:hypothetical protein